MVVIVAGLLAPAAASAADPAQPPLDRGVLTSLWKPIGFFKPGDDIPMPSAPPKPTGATGIYNPSGHWSAYDSNVFESLNFPGRQGGDTTDNDPPGTGMPVFGFCPPHPQYVPAGRCVNHALEYLKYYEATMNTILKDFGGIVRRYKFINPDSSAVGIPAGLSSTGGETFNIAGIVPGADHPEREVIVSGHWDFTDAGPAAAWDSSEGHATVIRIAKILTDYWRATGTRPAVTVKFMPWAAEESGSLGSQDYLDTQLADERDSLRITGYFNMDPCAGAYPAYYHGNPLERVPQVLQLAVPGEGATDERIRVFNEQMLRVVDEFFADIDDTVETVAGPVPVFTEADRPEIVTAFGGLLLFGSDYSNFEAIRVPIFNLFPDMFGPHADGTAASAEGATIIHTPRDNLSSLNALTGPDQTGLTASDGWMKGLELCAHIEARGMLLPDQGGAQTANLDPVAYMEPLPAKWTRGKLLTFDATGTYQYASLVGPQYIDGADLQYAWDFDDGSPVAYGKVVKHAFRKEGPYNVKLTVTNRDSHASDTIARRVSISTGNDNDADPDQSSDPGLRVAGSVVACQTDAGFRTASARPSGRGLRLTGDTRDGKPFVATVFRAATRRKATKLTRMGSFAVNGRLTWNGRLNGKRLAPGTYIVRLTSRGTGSRPDVRAFALRWTGSGFVARRAFQRPDSCGLISYLRLVSPTFSASRRLVLDVATTKDATVTATLSRRGVKPRRATLQLKANRLGKIRIPGRGLRRGEYRLRVGVQAGDGAKASHTLYAARL